MAREHARILCRIWSDKDFQQRSKGAQWMYMLLLSQKNLNHAGVIALTLQRWANCSKGTTTAEVQRYLSELTEHEYVVFDTDTEELLVRSLIRNDGVVKQPNVLKAALRLALEVDSPKLRAVLAKELRRLDHGEAARAADVLDPNPSGTLPEPLPKGSETPREGLASNRGEGGDLVVNSLSVVGSFGDASLAKRAQDPRGTRLPADWTPSESLQAWARKNTPDVNLRTESANFVDYWVAKPGKDGRKIDWDRTWQRWMRTADERLPKSARGRPADLNPDTILGADVWTPPIPPRAIDEGPPEARAAWFREQRAQRHAQRLAEAQEVLARRTA